MPVLDEIVTQKLQILEAKQQKRTVVSSMRHDGVYINRDGKKLISFSCNDYLGLTQHPRVIAAAGAALSKYGSGAGASRMVTGECPLYGELEALLAVFNKTEAACVFGSGYLANLGSIPALVGKNDLILADKISHACMIDGAKLSAATMLRFAHNNMNHLRLLLEANRNQYQNCLIITESIFSMDGDATPLTEIADIAQEFDSWLMVDSAHSYMPASISNPKIHVKMGTLSKAVGSYGGYVCGSSVLIDYIKNSARSLIFSTGLPPASLAASIEAIKIMLEEPERLEKPLKNASLFTSLLGLPEAQSAIVPLILEENKKVLDASKLLAENGFLVAAIRPPTVAENTARLRFTFSSLHEQEHIEKLCNIIKQQGWV